MDHTTAIVGSCYVLEDLRDLPAGSTPHAAAVSVAIATQCVPALPDLVWELALGSEDLANEWLLQFSSGVMPAVQAEDSLRWGGRSEVVL